MPRRARGAGNIPSALFLLTIMPAVARADPDATPPAPEDAPPETPPAPDEPEEADEDALVVTVTADRFERPVTEVPISVSVLGGRALEDARIVHLEDVLPLAPNLDQVGASARPRYLLIRGVGDLGTGDLVTNPTVGLLVDEVDLSGVGGALTTLDVDRVEILRGPQGTLYGTNALAGVIKVVSRAPTATPEARLELRLGTRNSLLVSAAGGGPVLRGTDALTFRAAGQVSLTDGFFTNRALDRRDTAGRREATARLKLRWQPDDATRIDLTGAFVDVRNGYDHWTLDGSTTTTTDRPGLDATRTGMGAIAVQADRGPVVVDAHVAVSQSDLRLDADYDWWSIDLPPPAGSLAAEGYAIDLFNRDRKQQGSLVGEVRVRSAPGRGPWGDRVRGLAGVHTLMVRQLRSVVLDSFGQPIEATRNDATYRRLSASAFGQLELDPVPWLTLTAGGRVEGAVQDYRDSQGVEDTEARPLFGWRLAATARLARPVSLFLAGSEGSKLGGFNLAPDSPVDRYLPETLRSAELGLRAAGADGAWRAALTGFYTARVNMQISEWIQRPGGDSADILFYTDNADAAWSAGFEAEVAGRPAPWLTLEATVGVLEARIGRWAFQSGSDTLDYSGLRMAHAPPWTASAAATVREPLTGVWGRVQVTARGRTQFANNNEISWPAYALMAVSAGWQGRHLGVGLWARNLTATPHAVAGFGPYFAPNDHVPFGNYYRLGDGPLFGGSVEAKF